MHQSYPKTISELYDLQKFSIKMGLENINSLCNVLDNPQNSYPIIHIAGTNGKGSTSIIINNILIAHGLKVGLYTSPHLVDFRERIRINNKLITKKYLIDYWSEIHNTVHQLKATFFDTTTALAFDYFAKSKVDISVIETGLGGRLDSTNIVQPVASVITPIAVDHVKQLGKKLDSIAQEKVLIVKKGSTFFSARQKKVVKDILQTASSKTKAYFDITKSIAIRQRRINSTHSLFNLIDKVRNIKMTDIKLNLAGEFQIDNACLGYLVARWYLDKIGIAFSEMKFRKVLSGVHWPGRLQVIRKNPMIYLDVSHNYAGFRESIKFITKTSDILNRQLIVGLLDDKEYKQIVRLLAKHFKRVILTEPVHERAVPAPVLVKEFLRYGIQPDEEKSIDRAFKIARQNLNKNDHLYVMGSHFIIGEILKTFNKKDLTE
jgi:dihydrofolate synthase/folylpolyglutamate synthase